MTASNLLARSEERLATSIDCHHSSSSGLTGDSTSMPVGSGRNPLESSKNCFGSCLSWMILTFSVLVRVTHGGKIPFGEVLNPITIVEFVILDLVHTLTFHQKH
jgi:hypothetical protein